MGLGRKLGLGGERCVATANPQFNINKTLSSLVILRMPAVGYIYCHCAFYVCIQNTVGRVMLYTRYNIYHLTMTQTSNCREQVPQSGSRSCFGTVWLLSWETSLLGRFLGPAPESEVVLPETAAGCYTRPDSLGALPGSFCQLLAAHP